MRGRSDNHRGTIEWLRWSAGIARRPAGTLLLAAGACMPFVQPVGTLSPVLGPRDSLALAYDTGRCDGLIIYPSHRPGIVFYLAVPVGLMVANRTGNYWMVPVSMTAARFGEALGSYGRTRAAVPAPPDSMRSRYGLNSPVLWNQYGRGFGRAVEDRRRADLNGSLRSALIGAFILIPLLARR